MREYNKIETVYARDENGSKKLIEGKFRSELVEYLKNNRWEFTEKIDGTNVRVHWDGHKVEFGGRTDRASLPADLFAKLSSLFMTNEAEELFEQKFGSNDVILFGEGYGHRIQKCGMQYRADVSFILFDVLVMDRYYLDRDGVENVAEAFGLDVVPVIMKGTIKEAVDFVKTKPASTIGTAPMEGLVGKPMVGVYDKTGHRVIVKIKACDF